MLTAAAEPTPPQRRRIVSTDPTVAKAERMSAANARGLLMLRDELAGWLAGLDRVHVWAGSETLADTHRAAGVPTGVTVVGYRWAAADQAPVDSRR